ncbi:MAG TPA: radical SAM family heme chaperone HemW [Pirellulaceae bacterium]|nr:radical SAM family heme chaperone HemW [Pirellulaceae bacterium]
MSTDQQPRAAYIHVPFCRHRCGYCNFTLVAGRDDLIGAYLDALERELSWLRQPHEVDTLFFGGGTPTHLAPRELERLLANVRARFPVAAGGEFSIEANPTDLNETKAAILAAASVTRVSLGVQSFDERKLAQLERDHLRMDIARAVDLARTFAQSVSLDLIFGVPGENLNVWREDLHLAIHVIQADHVSTYGLTFEKGTAFWSRLKHGELARVDEDLERQMYELAIDTLTAAGYEHYEVSNFARPGHRCRHNENYWLGGEYFAAGPGAARFIGGRRETNHRSTTTYIRRVLAGQSPVAESEQLGPEDAARERLVFALRRLEGIDTAAFAAATGFSIEQLGGDALPRLVDRGLLSLAANRLQLTRAGLLISDAIWPQFLRV